jgi:hypothetical protein
VLARHLSTVFDRQQLTALSQKYIETHRLKHTIQRYGGFSKSILKYSTLRNRMLATAVALILPYNGKSMLLQPKCCPKMGKNREFAPRRSGWKKERSRGSSNMQQYLSPQ